MKKLILPLIAAMLMVAGTLNAQTTDYTLGIHACGLYNAAKPYCYGIPATSSTGAKGGIWLDYTTTPNGSYGFVQFQSGYEGLGTATVLNIQPDGSLQFTGTDTNGVTYYGVLSYTFSTYRGCTGGRGYRCSNYWMVTGGNVSVRRVDY
jgi:hypothetical protein